MVIIQKDFVGYTLRVCAERPGDLKETFDMTSKKSQCGHWPVSEVPEFKSAMCEFYQACAKLSLRILNLIGIGLNLEDPDLFSRSHSHLAMSISSTTLRSLYYPPLPAKFHIKEKQIRCGEHTDYGSITLLFQDEIGGLEVMNREGQYMAAVPLERSILVNVGDLLQRWTADTLVSTKHRVVIPAEEAKRQKARQSFAFFVRPNDNCLIECIDGSNKYPPIAAVDYTNERFAATYAH